MAFTDVEMAIISQPSYNVSRNFEGESLYFVFANPEMNNCLKKSLGTGYNKQLSSLIDKVILKVFKNIHTNYEVQNDGTRYFKNMA